MAAGCVPICYDAFGGQDFLVDGENAFVFPNHHVYPLAEKPLALDQRRARADAMIAMRLRARRAAGGYERRPRATRIEQVFARLLAARAAGERLRPPARFSS